MSAHWPYRCTGTIALVFGVMAASILVGSMQLVRGSESTNTAVAPAIQMASAVAKKVLVVVMHSSPGPMPSAMEHQPKRIRSVAHADRVLGAVVSGEFLFEALQCRPHHVLAGLQNLLHVAVDFRLNIAVLPHMTIKRHVHRSRSLLVETTMIYRRTAPAVALVRGPALYPQVSDSITRNGVLRHSPARNHRRDSIVPLA